MFTIVAAMALSGCATFAIETPPRMVVLNEGDYSNYQWRATTPDGVVLAVRVIEQDDSYGSSPRGSMDFWADAIRLRLRTQSGYALIEEKVVTAKSGEEGRQLRFGRDEGTTPYVYWITLFRTDDYVHVVECGGKKELFDTNQQAIERAIASYEVKK
jgi:hypothetical protein